MSGLVTVYDVRCRVRSAIPAGSLPLPPGVGVILSAGTWRDSGKACEVAGRLAHYGAYVMPLDVPGRLVDQICDE